MQADCEQQSNAEVAHQPSGRERRRAPRFEIDGARVGIGDYSFDAPGTFVTVGNRSLFGLLPRRGGQLDNVKDISRGGLCFETDGQYEVGQRVTLSLHVRDWSGPMQLRAEVRWVRPVYVDMLDMVGLQFSPFDGSRGGNSTEAGEALIRLEETYMKAIEAAKAKAESQAAARSPQVQEQAEPQSRPDGAPQPTLEQGQAEAAPEAAAPPPLPTADDGVEAMEVEAGEVQELETSEVRAFEAEASTAGDRAGDELNALRRDNEQLRQRLASLESSLAARNRAAG